MVSHDRYFLDRVVRRTFAFEGGGAIGNYNGGYSDYAARKAEDVEIAKAEAKDKRGKTGENRDKDAEKVGARQEAPKRLKFTYKEEKEYETIEEDITNLEIKLEEVEKAMGKCGADFVKLGELDQKKQELEENLMEKMERWEYLSDLAERISEQNEIFRKQKRK